MSIDDRIKEVCASELPEFSYVLENWYDADTAIDRVKLPAVICVLPVSGTLELHNGRSRDSESLQIAFVDKVPRNADGEDNAATYTCMKDAAVRFLRGVQRCGYFAPLSGRISYRVICEKLSSIVTGVCLELELEELIGVCDGRGKDIR